MTFHEAGARRQPQHAQSRLTDAPPRVCGRTLSGVSSVLTARRSCVLQHDMLRQL